MNAIFTLRQTRELNLSISIRYKIKGIGRVLLACIHFRPSAGTRSCTGVLLQNKFYALQRCFAQATSVALFLNSNFTIGCAVFRVNMDIKNPVRQLVCGSMEV